MLLVQHGADVNELDEKHRTALHVACKHGDVGMVELLLQFGADASLEGGITGLCPDVTPLEEACGKGYLAAV